MKEIQLETTGHMTVTVAGGSGIHYIYLPACHLTEMAGVPSICYNYDSNSLLVILLIS